MGGGEDLTGLGGWQEFVGRPCMGKVGVCVGCPRKPVRSKMVWGKT